MIQTLDLPTLASLRSAYVFQTVYVITFELSKVFHGHAVCNITLRKTGRFFLAAFHVWANHENLPSIIMADLFWRISKGRRLSLVFEIGELWAVSLCAESVPRKNVWFNCLALPVTQVLWVYLTLHRNFWNYSILFAFFMQSEVCRQWNQVHNRYENLCFSKGRDNDVKNDFAAWQFSAFTFYESVFVVFFVEIKYRLSIMHNWDSSIVFSIYFS